ncbi:MAG: aminotransferase class I/II-fold pyridoxal phosphate-dependent enzyme, partial [Pseudonocardia sp.]|nr:aminotransferase class I/II-fold pyridoxal phosphate-dependent enzyme [Pseudonocardia sp.]
MTDAHKRCAEGGSRALAWLEQLDADRRAAGLHRDLLARTSGTELIDLASNDYLGLVRHPEVVAGAAESLRRWGTGSTGSRLVTGTTAEHETLERELAAFVGSESGLVFSSGYTANLGAVTALAGRGSLVVSDAGSHASLVDACRLSRARVAVSPHADVEGVARLLAERTEQRALVLTDSVFSADGDLAPLRSLHRVCREHGALLLVDEAHGLGVRGAGGRGLVHEMGLAGEPDVIVTATLSKSLAGQGGVVRGGGSEVLVPRTDADGAVPGGDDLAESVRELQATGHVVAVLSEHHDAALAAADVGIGLVPSGGTPAWTADTLIRTLSEACLLLEAIEPARRVGRRAAQLAAAGSGLGVLLALLGPPVGAPARASVAVHT